MSLSRLSCRTHGCSPAYLPAILPRSVFSRFLVCAGIWLALAVAAPPPAHASLPEAGSLSELQAGLLQQKPDLDLFRSRGPFEVTVRTDHEIRLSARERFKADLYLTAPEEKAPLVVFLHGHDCSKEAHAKQAAHLASWGLHSMSLQLSRTGPWDTNARILQRIVTMIHRSPALIDPRVDASRLILVGHSFGGYAVSVALSRGAPAAAGILLDAAMYGRTSPEYLRRIGKPMMLLAADETLSPVRYREHFYQYMRRNVAEISVKGATHEDAQYPSETALQNNGVDPDVTEALQLTFVSALTATALSLSATRSVDYAWASFDDAIRSGRLMEPKRK